ncbi:MAG: ABC transporter permease [Bacteroidetes bacterium]|nr:ABC transporter permease [Bacteroidota bacterium]
MIKKLVAAIKKEMLILLRDRIGLAILFIMPMILIFVMTLIQDSAFKSLNEKGIPIIFVNEDKDSLGYEVERGLRNSELCAFNNQINGKYITADEAKKAVADGKFLVGIVIPKNATNAIRKNVQELVESAFSTDTIPPNKPQSVDSVEVKIFIDPVTKKSFLTSISSNLREFISGIKTQLMFKTFSDQLAELIPEKSK